MQSAEEQGEKATRGQRLKLSALMVEHNPGFGVMSKEAIEFWLREPGAAVIYAANALEAEYKKQNPR
jgi:hypothetical protein